MAPSSRSNTPCLNEISQPRPPSEVFFWVTPRQQSQWNLLRRVCLHSLVLLTDNNALCCRQIMLLICSRRYTHAGCCEVRTSLPSGKRIIRKTRMVRSCKSGSKRYAVYVNFWYVSWIYKQKVKSHPLYSKLLEVGFGTGRAPVRKSKSNEYTLRNKQVIFAPKLKNAFRRKGFAR